ncbi:MAG TPA: flagellin lysine-N-methylase [Myxococcaceae bacterium]|nr:flagellin lysine-N-methylase [Myxococcaceae bacterium]
MTLDASAPRYMSRFRCIAERCEDTCCTGLTIPVSADRYGPLVDALGRNRATAGLVQLVVRDESGEARIPVKSDSCCPFLDKERLCAVQRHSGEAVLPDVCVFFPRFLYRRGERLEVSASLACPETARLCLLAEDAMEPVPVPLDVAKRPELARTAALEDAYERYEEQVRATALALLGRREYPLGSRLLFLGQLALRLEDFYFRGTTAFEGAAREEAEARLSAELAAFGDEALLDALHARFSALELPPGMCAGLFGSVLRTRVRSSPGARFERLAGAALASMEAGAESAEPDAVGLAYVQRRNRLDAADPARVARYFRNFCQNHFVREPFTGARSLLPYVFTLAMRAGLLRFVLAGHPVVETLGPGEDAASAEAGERLDAAAVETFQLVAKHVERKADFVELIRTLSGASEAETFGKVLVFARFC